MKELAGLYVLMIPVFWLLTPFAVFMLVIGYPILAYRAVRNLALIERHLERLQNTVEARPGVTRTGPLGI